MKKTLTVTRLFLLGVLAVINWFLVFIMVSFFVKNDIALFISIGTVVSLVALGFTSLGENYFRLLNRLRRPFNFEHDRLMPILEKVLSRYPVQVEKPELFISGDVFPNALAVGRRTVAVTAGLLRTASDEELAGVIVHEVGHIVNGDTRFLLVASILNSLGLFSAWVITGILAILAIVSEVLGRLGGFGVLFTLPVLAVTWFFRAAAWVVFKVIDLSFLAIGREQEFAADKFASELGFGSGLGTYLVKLENCTEQPTNGLMARFFATHPDTRVRLERLG